MHFYDFVDVSSPLVFSPKVKPDLMSAKRLDEKMNQAINDLKSKRERQENFPGPAPAAAGSRQH